MGKLNVIIKTNWGVGTKVFVIAWAGQLVAINFSHRQLCCTLIAILNSKIPSENHRRKREINDNDIDSGKVVFLLQR